MIQGIPLKQISVPDNIDVSIDHILDTIQTDILKQYEKTYSTWKHKPRFTVRVLNKGYKRDITTQDEIYGYVELGTRPHEIRAKGVANGGADRLAFRSGFTAKTKPKVLSSFAGAKFGEWRNPISVQHPGTEPRDFTGEIVKQEQDYLERLVKKELRNWTR